MRVTTQIGISGRMRATSIRQSMDSSKRSPPPFQRRYVALFFTHSRAIRDAVPFGSPLIELYTRTYLVRLAGQEEPPLEK